jgi:hypothetical protein
MAALPLLDENDLHPPLPPSTFSVACSDDYIGRIDHSVRPGSFIPKTICCPFPLQRIIDSLSEFLFPEGRRLDANHLPATDSLTYTKESATTCRSSQLNSHDEIWPFPNESVNAPCTTDSLNNYI